MRKLIVGIVVAIVLMATAIPLAVVSAQTAGPLDHVVITPSTTTLPTGGTQQFTAVGQDASSVAVSNVSYAWTVVAGGGTISNTGLFTAGATAGTYTNTVEVSAVANGITKTAFATVSVTVVPSQGPSSVPPGWSHGKKTGWHGASMPPGLAMGKKNNGHGQ